MIEEPAGTRIKICGITNLDDAQVAAQAGADLLGFIFYEPSPRYVTPEAAGAIVQALGAGAGRPLYVGVFVNAPPETVAQVLDFCGLDAAQLHGDEPPEWVSRFQGRAYKALRPQNEAEADSLLARYPPAATAASLPALLLDAYHPTLYGGTGHATNWTMAARIARRYPLLLAGSLTPANAAQAIRAVRPWGIDASSGVEAAKGKKDHDKVRALITAVRSVKRDQP